MKKLYNKKQKKSRKKSEEFFLPGNNAQSNGQCGIDGERVARPLRVSVELPQSTALALDDIQAAVEEYTKTVGLTMMRAMMDAEVDTLAGARYERNSAKPGSRWGKENGYVVYKGQKVPITHQRVRSKNGKQELPMETYAAFQNEGPMLDKIFERVVLGVSQRNYERSVDEFADGYGIGRSSVSRKFKLRLAKKLKELNERRFDNVEFVAIFADGIHLGESVAVAALGVDIGGRKHVLGLRTGTTENSTVCRELFADIIDRGLAADRPYLFVIDGGTGLKKAIREVFGGGAPVQRCRVHKKRNVMNKLPKKYHAGFERRFNLAVGMTGYDEARSEMAKIVKYLESISGSAAGSLREGLDDLLTLHRLGVTGVLRKTLSTTNLIESPFATCRGLTRNVKRWRKDGQIAGWMAAMLLETEKAFRRVKGYRDLEKLKEVLERSLKKSKISA